MSKGARVYNRGIRRSDFGTAPVLCHFRLTRQHCQSATGLGLKPGGSARDCGPRASVLESAAALRRFKERERAELVRFLESLSDLKPCIGR